MRIWIALWFVLIALISMAPFHIKKSLGTIGTFHSAGHVFVFAASSIMLVASAQTLLSRLRRILFVFLFSTILETAQAGIYHIPFEWRDLWIDYSAAGISPILLYARRLIKH